MISSNDTVYNLFFSLLNVTPLTDQLPVYGTGPAKALFSGNAPETHKTNCVVFRISNPPTVEVIQQNTVTATWYIVDVMYMVEDVFKSTDWPVITTVKSILHQYRNTNYGGYLIDIIANQPLPTIPSEINGIRYTVEGYRFDVCIRESGDY